MWSVVLLVFSVITLSLAQFDSIKYTGSLKPSSPKFHPPSWDDNNTCVVNQNTYVYKWFTINLTQSGVWHIVASADQSIQKNLQQPITRTLQGPVVSDFVYLHHPSYVFVVAAPVGYNGTFGINSGTTVGSPLWPIAVLDSGTCQVKTNTLSTPFAYYTWTQPSDGLFDIYIMFDSPLTSWFSFIALYNSGLTWQQLQTPCSQNGAGRYLQSASGSVGAKGAGLWYQQLKARTNYTIAFSGYGGVQIRYYGIRIVPTQVRKPFQTSFVQPQRDISQCYSDPYHTDSSWDAIQFTANHQVYLIDTADVVPPLTWFDTYSFLYEGQNAGSPPVGCPYFAQLVAQADTGDIHNRKGLTTIGTNYTAIISTFSGRQTGTSQDFAYILYVITGDYIPDNQPAHSSPSSCSIISPFNIIVLFVFWCLLIHFEY